MLRHSRNHGEWVYIVIAHENQSIYSIDLFVYVWSRDPAIIKECELLSLSNTHFVEIHMAWWIKSEATQKGKSILEIEQNGCSEYARPKYEVPGMLVPTMKLPSWSIFYISLAIDRLFILSSNEQQNWMQIWMWTLSMGSNRGFKSRHRLFNFSLFLSIFLSFSPFFVHLMYSVAFFEMLKKFANL